MKSENCAKQPKKVKCVQKSVKREICAKELKNVKFMQKKNEKD